MSPRGKAVRVSTKSTSGETIFEVRRLFGDFNIRSHGLAGEKFLLINKTASDGNVKVTIYYTPASDSYQAKLMEDRLWICAQTNASPTSQSNCSHQWTKCHRKSYVES